MMLSDNRVIQIRTVNDNSCVPLDFSDIPISALGHRTRTKISLLLNPKKILPTEEGLPRDWRGLAHLTGIPGEDLPSLSNIPDATSRILSWWGKNGNIKVFQHILARLDRWDIIDDIKDMIDDDVNKYNMSTMVYSPETTQILPIDHEDDILTIDDVSRNQQGLDIQYYDAYVLYANEDVDFATELVEKMEHCGFKLCIKERDLIGGQFEHEAVMRLIAERCHRLIIIVSPAFFESSANTFFINFAQAIGIEQRKRKILPCVYKHCPLPLHLSFYFRLDYNRSSKLWNFWDKLRDSLQRNQILKETTRNRTTSSVVIREIEQPLNKDIDIAHSLPKNFAICTSNPVPSIIETPTEERSSTVQTSLTDLDYLNSTSISVTSSSQDLSDKTNGKVKRPKWYKKLIKHKNIRKLDKKQVPVAL